MYVNQVQKYRFVHIEDPPTEYGVGLDDGESDYWVEFYARESPILPEDDPVSVKIYSRRGLPVDSEIGPLSPWVEEDLTNFNGLWILGKLLSTIRVSSLMSEVRGIGVGGEWDYDSKQIEFMEKLHKDLEELSDDYTI